MHKCILKPSAPQCAQTTGDHEVERKSERVRGGGRERERAGKLSRRAGNKKLTAARCSIAVYVGSHNYCTAVVVTEAVIRGEGK